MSDPFEVWEAELEVDTPDIVNVRELSNIELLTLYKSQKDILLALGEVIHPKTQEGRDAHSLYGACKIEIKRRGLV